MDFHLVDWLILVVSLILVFYFGLQSRRYVKTSGDYLVAGRRMGVHLGTISLVSTEIGLVTYMYYAEMGFLYGFTAIISGLITAGAYFFLGTTGFVIRKIRELELVTISQFFEQRYSHRVRILAGILMAIGGALNFGVFPVIEATFLNIVTGIPREYIVWTMVALLILVLLYTALGGMISVLVTNYIQYVVLVFAMIIVTAYCLVKVGLPAMISAVENQIGESGFNPIIHPSFGWEFIFWQILMWLAAVLAWAPVANHMRICQKINSHPKD
ncbi:MAG TPA: sodium:solute symporter family protein, partial [Acidobacteriota bacterium]|nr:sodium:solute symporter family protein [Acidobacteriota bacterium]